MYVTPLVLWLGSVALAEAPATTLLHDVDVRIDGLLRLTEQVTWTVRIDDPAACSAGVSAPPGLSGASDANAVVLGDLLVVPPTLAPGTVLTLQGRRTASPAMPHSGLLVGVDGIPAERTRLAVTAPVSTELSVWADELGQPSFTELEGRRVVVEWGAHDGEHPSLASYGTFQSWAEAGRMYRDLVASRVGPSRELGRTLSQELAGRPIPYVVELMHARLPLGQRARGFAAARPTRELASADAGSAAERALLLLQMLRRAGHDAHPVLVRPAGAPGDFPATVVAPHAYFRPAVRVDRPDLDPVYIDPALPPGPTEALPVTLRGADVWALDGPPQRLRTATIDDGRVSVETAVAFTPAGEARIRSTLTAEGAGDDEIRHLLRPLGPEGRSASWSRLVGVGLPDVRTIEVTFEGVDDPDGPLMIVTEVEPATMLDAEPYGFAGTVPPLLAPALAAWLPPRLRIEESVSVVLPDDWQVLGASTALSPSGPAEVFRSLSRRDRDAAERMEVEVRRSAWERSPQREAATVGFLEGQAREGLELIVGVGGPGRVARRLATDPRFSEADRVALEGLGWAAAGSRGKARAAFRAGGRQLGLERVVAAVARWAHPGDERPWTVLDKLSRRDDRSAVAVLEGLARIGATREARALAERLADSRDPVVRTRVALVQRWELGELDAVERADEAGRASRAGLPDRERLRIALAWLSRDDVDDARVWLDSVADPLAPSARAVRLALLAAGGRARQDVLVEADGLLAEAPSDVDVLIAVALALGDIGEAERAASLVRTVARWRSGVPARWDAVVQAALDAGDLPLALDAAERAAALTPESEARGERVLELATGLGDPLRVLATWDRLGRSAPTALPSLAERLARFPDHHLAVLRTADLSGDRDALAERAKLELGAGMPAEASRDALWLVHRGDRRGLALAFASGAGQLVSTPLLAALEDSGDETAAAALTEYAVITAAFDVQQVARPDLDASAEILLSAIARPMTAGKAVAGWPDAAPVAQGTAPTGVVANPALGAHPGAQGWSRPAEMVGFLQVPGDVRALPPPLGLLYDPATRPERLTDDLEVRRLHGGVLPLFLARRVVAGHTRQALAFTAAAAERALLGGWSTSRAEATPISPDDDNR